MLAGAFEKGPVNRLTMGEYRLEQCAAEGLHVPDSPSLSDSNALKVKSDPLIADI